jgi:Fe-S-cluster containining protein
VINPCSICSAHCCKNYVITVTSFDVLRICQNTNKKAEDFALFHPPRLLSFDADTILDFEDDYRGGILSFKSHPCIFLGKDNLCTAHEHAPMSCRRYPYQLNDKLNARFCPLPSEILFRIKGPDINKSPLIKELDEYKEIVKEWNKNPGKKDECLSFIIARTRFQRKSHR